MALNAQRKITIDKWHQEIHCKYSYIIQNPYVYKLLMPVIRSVSVHWTNGCVVSILMCLQEIRCGRSGRNDSFRVGHCSEELWLSCVSIFEDHNRGNVAAAIAVVRSRPHCDQLLVKHKLVALMDKLMCPADQLQVVDVNKLQVFGRQERESEKYA